VWSRRARTELSNDYLKSLLFELRRWADDRRWTYRSVRSVTFKLERDGLEPRAIGELVGAIQRTFAFLPGCRITCESLPRFADEFSPLVENGIERFFLPVVSFDKKTLRAEGGALDAATARSLIEGAMSAGFGAVAVKLIFGSPGQTVGEFRTDLSRLIVHTPHEVIFSPSNGRRKLGRRSLAVDQLTKMKGIIEAVMGGLGYEESRLHHYVRGEASVVPEDNIADGHRLGIGAGGMTVTTDGLGRRIVARNAEGPREYMWALARDGRAWRTEEALTPEEEIGAVITEMFYRRSGLDLGAIERRFGIDVERACPGVLEVLIDAAFVRRSGDEIALTKAGHVAIDDVVAQFRGSFAGAAV
jgi:coproporphyrinogen III oxidase-like Fe-S oxidoreductase